MIVDPVPTTLLFCGGGGAGIYGVAFIPFLRGRGIGGAISLKPLLDARDEGYRHAVLFASEEGRGPHPSLPLAERLVRNPPAIRDRPAAGRPCWRRSRLRRDDGAGRRRRRT